MNSVSDAIFTLLGFLFERINLGLGRLSRFKEGTSEGSVTLDEVCNEISFSSEKNICEEQ